MAPQLNVAAVAETCRHARAGCAQEEQKTRLHIAVKGTPQQRLAQLGAGVVGVDLRHPIRQPLVLELGVG